MVRSIRHRRAAGHCRTAALIVVAAALLVACGPDSSESTAPTGWAWAASRGGATAPPTLAAPAYGARFVTDGERFETGGDVIEGWWWLRDGAGTNRAMWVFSNVPMSTRIRLDLHMLATDRIDGPRGIAARFWLSYGSASAGTGAASGSAIVSMPNVSPPGDPVGYTTQGVFDILPASLPAGTTAIWVIVRRCDENGASIVPEHLAVQEDSVSVYGASGGADATPSATASPTPTPTPQPTPTPIAGDGPGHGTPAVVSIGDSYIAGEGGRWAGNINVLGQLSTNAIDAGGPTAYLDNADHTAEVIPGCHRSRSAEIHIDANQYGPRVISANLACSGATTETHIGDNGAFKPGLDAYGDPDGDLTTYEPNNPNGLLVSQTVALREFARTHNVTMVVVSIGGNDFHFGDVVEQCVRDFLFSTRVHKDLCLDDAVARNFDAGNAALRRVEVSAALQNVYDAMSGAGYPDSGWTLLVQNYPSPVPNGSGIRYGEDGMKRQTEGGCGLWDEDADWANNKALRVVNETVKDAARSLPYTNVRTLDISEAFVGRRLCENTVGTLDAQGFSVWWAVGALDKTEWIAPIRGVYNDDLADTPYQKQESFHPNYWGELALRNCVRQAYLHRRDYETGHGGVCRILQTGLNDRGEPQMVLTAR
jgi:hypothetical protein